MSVNSDVCQELPSSHFSFANSLLCTFDATPHAVLCIGSYLSYLRKWSLQSLVELLLAVSLAIQTFGEKSRKRAQRGNCSGHRNPTSHIPSRVSGQGRNELGMQRSFTGAAFLVALARHQTSETDSRRCSVVPVVRNFVEAGDCEAAVHMQPAGVDA